MPLDTSETQKLIDALDKFDSDVRSKAEAVLVKGAVEARKNLQAEAKNSKYFKQIGRSINFDKKKTRNGIEIELGPDKERADAGKLANIAYFGGANGGGGTLDFDEPVEREFNTIDDYLGKLGDAL